MPGFLNRAACLAPIVLAAGGALAAQGGDPGGGGGGGAETIRLWPLFRQSFDVFSVVLIAGSLLAVAIMVRTVIDVRASRILPKGSVERITRLAEQGRWQELREHLASDESFLGRVLRGATGLSGRDRGAIREAAELAASEECATWFRKIEMLNVIGNLGPLVGLAGTVWGMILAFTSLGYAGGQAGPSQLSLGISKALFHTLLGLCLAIPCLLVYGYYRSIIDRHCTRGMVLASEVVERLPAGDEA
jgi:biopolymer transport protein ExbB